MRLEVAGDKDVEFIANVCRDMRELYDPIMLGAFERQAKRYEVNRIPSLYQIKLIINDKEKIGFVAQMSLTSNTVYIVVLYFLMSWQRKGFGSKVLAKVMKEVEDSDVNRLLLIVHKRATWAIDFYLKNGFVVVAENEEQASIFEESIRDYYLPNTYLMSYSIS